MNLRIHRPLYISFKSWLCCCSLPSVAPQQIACDMTEALFYSAIIIYSWTKKGCFDHWSLGIWAYGGMQNDLLKWLPNNSFPIPKVTFIESAQYTMHIIVQLLSSFIYLTNRISHLPTQEMSGKKPGNNWLSAGLGISGRCLDLERKASLGASKANLREMEYCGKLLTSTRFG